MRGKPLPHAVTYGAALLLAVLANLARFPLHPPTLIPFITYTPFILLSAYQGGFGPGVVTTVLCCFESLYFSTEPVRSFRVRDPHDWLGVAALMLTGVVASTLFERLQKAQRAVAAAELARSEMARELEARRKMLESAVQHAPVPIALLRGRDFRFVMVNPAYQALAPREVMTGRTVAEVWPEAAGLLLPVLQRVRERQIVYHTTGMAIPRHREPGVPPEERYFDFSCVPLPGVSLAAPGSGAEQLMVVAIEVTEQHRSAAALEETLRELESALVEKTVLLKEVHHRVKNNLAVIVSLLGMKAGAIETAEAQGAIEDSQRRVRSIALIHEQLSGTDHLDRIVFAEYAGQLVRELGGVYGAAARGIELFVDAEPVELDVHRAIPCALILNELVTNALKHAFPGERGGEVRVSFRESAPGERELSVQDNGVGCPRMQPERAGKSLGLRIVEILAKQLEGVIDQQQCAGARFVLRFH